MGGRTFNMDQIKFIPQGQNGRNSQSESADVAKPKNNSTQNIFKSNALKNLSKNMAAPSIVKESRDDSFGDYNDPLEKEARDFINSQLDVRLSTKSKDEMMRNMNKNSKLLPEPEGVQIVASIAKSYPLVLAKYEQGSTVKK